MSATLTEIGICDQFLIEITVGETNHGNISRWAQQLYLPWMSQSYVQIRMGSVSINGNEQLSFTASSGYHGYELKLAEEVGSFVDDSVNTKQR